MHATALADGTKKFGSIGLVGSPGSPSGLRQANTDGDRLSDVAITNRPSLLTAAPVSFVPAGIAE